MQHALHQQLHMLCNRAACALTLLVCQARGVLQAVDEEHDLLLLVTRVLVPTSEMARTNGTDKSVTCSDQHLAIMLGMLHTHIPAQ
jgi:hypothetical protein